MRRKIITRILAWSHEVIIIYSPFSLLCVPEDTDTVVQGTILLGPFLYSANIIRVFFSVAQHQGCKILDLLFSLGSHTVLFFFKHIKQECMPLLTLASSTPHPAMSNKHVFRHYPLGTQLYGIQSAALYIAFVTVWILSAFSFCFLYNMFKHF